MREYLSWALRMNLRVGFAALLFVGLVTCATSQLPKDSTFAEQATAVCADLDAAVLLAQIGLSYAQQSN